MFEQIPGFSYSGIMNMSDYALAKEAVLASYDIHKAMTTGSGIVQPGTTGGMALRMQYLHGVLEKVSFEQDDAKFMKRVVKKPVYEPTFEWTVFNQYGGPGDGFVAETGTDGAFGVSGTDDNFTRLVAQVKYMAAVRTISLPIQEARNIEDAMKVAEQGATLELIGKANLACYFGDSKKSITQFDGITRQMLDWVSLYNQDQDILYDAGGQPISEDLLQEVAKICRQKYGQPQLLMQSAQGFADTQRLLFPKERTQLGTTNGTSGVVVNRFASAFGNIELDFDIMLRPNQPLAPDGMAVSGLPRTTATADSGCLTWNATPWTTAPAAVAPGTGNWWVPANLNSDAAAMTTAPALPSGPGNQACRLPVGGTYFYAISTVVAPGLESPAWVYGASSAGVVTGATGITTSAANPIVQIVLNLSNNPIPGYGSTVPVNGIKYRLYRCDNATPTSMNSFNFLMEFGSPASGNPTAYDNGMYIPGSDNAFLFTEKKNGADGYMFAQLLPLMRRPLPNLMMGNPLGILLFGCPVLLVRRHHVYIRNIGRYTM